MNKIHELPAHVVAKIAAGEVIERPVFAVKELVENSLDAGADSITINIEECGLKRITVIDNGEGMSNEDLQECFKPHTTSKISTTDELSFIKTLGFRGEALASIAAIGKMIINTRTAENPTGISITVINSNLNTIAPIGMPPGTVVTVENLFHTLPARKKFLMSLRTELRHIIELITGYALSYPEISFILIHNRKTLFDLPITNDPLVRIQKLLGNDTFESMIPVSFTDSYIAINGLLAKPNITTRTPSKQFIFINNRYVTDKSITLAVKNSYGSLLPNQVYPVCILHFSLPYEMVDVNVHPRKEYVRFADITLIQKAITQAVNQSLAKYDLISFANIHSLFLRDSVGSTLSYAGKLLKEKKLPWELPVILDKAQIMQLNNVYMLVLTNNGFMVFDQHATHERIIYEQLLNEFLNEKEKHSIFHFPKPGIFDVSISEKEILIEHIESFKKFGWEIEHFNNTTFIIRSLPVIFQDRDYVKLLQELLVEMKEDGLQKNIDEISRQMIAYLACHAAVKKGDKLSKKQMKELILQLEKSGNNATCPHGRPTRILITIEKIDQLFKRN